MKKFLMASGMSKAQFRTAAQDLSKDDVIALGAEAIESHEKAQAMTVTNGAIGLGSGLGAGELINFALAKWAESTWPLAETINDWFPGLRIAPHALLGFIAILINAKMETRAQIIGLFSGVGIGLPALVRFFDWLIHKGDLSKDEEAQLKNENTRLKEQLAQMAAAKPATAAAGG